MRTLRSLHSVRSYHTQLILHRCAFSRLDVCAVLFTIGLFFFGTGVTLSDQVSQAEPNSGDARLVIGQKYWVAGNGLNRRTCPETKCGVVGQLQFREAVTVHEQRGSWARISEPYNASCIGGRSEFVDRGNAECDASNGIIDGQFAEWVAIEFLSNGRPDDPAASAAGWETLIRGSDDFAQYRSQFAKAAKNLIQMQKCNEADFREMGG